MSEIEKTIDSLGRAFEEFKETNDKRVKEIEQRGEATSETTEKLDRIEKRMNDLNEEKKTLEQRLVEAETKLDTPHGNGADRSVDSPEARQHVKAFERFVRSFGQDEEAKRELRDVEAEMRKRATLIGTNSLGGFAVPEVIASQIERQVLQKSPLRQYARVVTVGTSDYKELVDIRGEGGGWVGEGDARSETDTSSLAECAPSFGIVYAYPKASEEALQDIFFDVGNWLATNSADTLASLEGEAFVTGNGTKKPTGFLNGTPVSQGDYDTSPSLDHPDLQYFATGVADGFGTLSTTSPENYPGDVLLDTIYGLKNVYRQNARWMANPTTIATVRKFRDADGNYLWAPGLAAGQPSTLLGYEVIEDDYMPDIAANAFPMAFGDWQRGYLVADRVGMSVTVDDNITTPGYVKWYIRRRVGGAVLNNHAIKLVKAATS